MIGAKQTGILPLAMMISLISLVEPLVQHKQSASSDIPALAQRNDQASVPEGPNKDRRITLGLTYDASSIESLFAAPEKVLKNISSFWESDDGYRLIRSWHRYNNIPIDYDGWKPKLEDIASVPLDRRQADSRYSLARDILGARDSFIGNTIPHLCSFLPQEDVDIVSTAHFVAFTYPRAVSLGDRIAIDIFNPYYRGSLPAILSCMLHELYHVGFGHIQFGRTDPEFDNAELMRVLNDLQNEGMATYVAYRGQRFFPAPNEADFSMLEVPGTVSGLIQRLNRLLSTAASTPRDKLQREAWKLGVEDRAYYVVGAHMARTIDEKVGRETLTETVRKGPITFIREYNAIAEKGMQICELEPPVEFSLVERLRQAVANKEYDEYDKCLVELGKVGSEIDRSKEDSLLKIGLMFMQRKRYDQAIEIFALDAELFPESAPAYNFLGKAYAKSGNYESALECARKSVALDPMYVDAVENLKKLEEED